MFERRRKNREQRQEQKREEQELLQEDQAEETDSVSEENDIAEEGTALAAVDAAEVHIEETEASDKASDGISDETFDAAPDKASNGISDAVSDETPDETFGEISEKEAEFEAPWTDTAETEKRGLFKRLRQGLSKTRNNIVHGFDGVFKGHSHIDDDFYEELEELLVMGDIGIRATEAIIENLQEKVREHNLKEPADCRSYLMSSIREQLTVGETAYRFEEETSVVLVIGVNGVGKTTTIGKLAGKLKNQNKKVILAAADTFRAAAGEQLIEWAHRADADIISGQEGSDPGAVVYDAVQAAKARKADVLLCDTAGRLHNKKNLMAELEKINRILDKEYPDAYKETLVVLDATTGQNALEQARQFNEVTDITGIVLTKMDGTAKGGIAVAISSELGIPVKYIGVGETIDDLQKFDPESFVEALFDRGSDEEDPED